MASRQQAFEIARNDVQKAQAGYDLFEADKPELHGGRANKEDDKSFLANKLFSTYPDIDKVRSQIESLRQQADFAYKQSDTMVAFWRQQDLLNELGKLEDFVNQVESEKENNLNTAKTREIDAAAILRNSPTVEDYITAFSPTVVQKTLSDADGRFSFIYPRNKSLTLYASAQRTTLNGTEKYYWLIDAPTNAQTVQVFLSNNNLVSVDPDNYFKLKPK